MTPQPPPYYASNPPPSWVPPILLGLIATVLMHLPSMFLFRSDPLMCCCGCSGIPVGIFPALLALRRDPQMGPGSGFAVAFIGVGLGAISIAILQILQGWEISDELLQTLRESMLQQAQNDPNLTPEQVDDWLALVAEFSRYFPVIGAGLVTIWGGVAGAVTVAIGRRRRPPVDPYNPYGYGAGTPPDPQA